MRWQKTQVYMRYRDIKAFVYFMLFNTRAVWTKIVPGFTSRGFHAHLNGLDFIGHKKPAAAIIK